MALALGEVTALLEKMAPLEHAESWDNVGLLLEPPSDRNEPGAAPNVRRALLLVDFTDKALDEALERDVDLVVAYHPPIFEPLKRLRAALASERVVARAARAGLAVYSPHTALDAAPDGVNDWLAGAVGAGTRRPLVGARRTERAEAFKLVVFVPAEHTEALRSALAEAGAGVIGNYTECSFELAGTGSFLGGSETKPAVGERGRLVRVPETRLEMVCPENALPRAAAALRRVHPYEEPAWEIYPLAAKPMPGVGAGRAVELDEALTLGAVVERVKAHLGRGWVRVAAAPEHAKGAPIRRVAVCAGSGGGLLSEASNFDLYLTGELRHHDVLRALSRGTSVVLCEHSSSERGFLRHFADRLREVTAGRIEVLVSEADRDPVEIG
jgi:dinuclear metal center YbgI/SA1388 family protein